MKILSRDFTLGERVLLVFLALVLVGLCYYYFVDIPVRDAITSSDAEVAALKKELSDYEARLMYLKGIRQNLDEQEKSGMTGWMGSYNNSKAEVAFLNGILAGTLQYSVTFADVTRAGNQIRRSFTLEYRVEGYPAAHEIMARLNQSHDRCLVSDASCSLEADGIVAVRQSATFYETMVGGTPDAGLPRDSAATNS